MSLSPPVQEVKVGRGGRAPFQITINNSGDRDVSCKMLALDMDMTEEGRPFPAEEGYHRGCGGWISFTPEEYTIKARTTVKVKGTVQAPRETSGGYYALCKARFVSLSIPVPLTDNAGPQRTTINIVDEAAVALLVTVTSRENKAILLPDTVLIDTAIPRGSEPPMFPGLGPSGSGWQVTIPVQNHGNVHTIAKGQVSIWSETMRLIGSAELEAGKGYVLPARHRIFTARGDKPLMDGIYVLKVSIFSREGRTVSNSLPFTVERGIAEFGIGSEEARELLRVTSPGFILNDPFKELSISPGGRSYGAVVLKNVIADTLKAHAWVTGWMVDNDGGLTIGDRATTHPRSCSHWINLDQASIEVPPKSDRALKFSLEVPEDASGEYYAAIVFDRDFVRKDLPTDLVAPRTQLIAAVVKSGLTYAMQIDSINITKIKPETYEFSFKLRNTGTAGCSVNGEFELASEIVKDLYKSFEEPKKFGGQAEWIMPGGERLIKIEWPSLPKGGYEAKLTVTYSPTQEPKVSYQRFRLK